MATIAPVDFQMFSTNQRTPYKVNIDKRNQRQGIYKPLGNSVLPDVPTPAAAITRPARTAQNTAYTPLSFNQQNTFAGLNPADYAGVSMDGFRTPQTKPTFAFGNVGAFNPDSIGTNAVPSFGLGATTNAVPTGGMWDGFTNLLGQGKEAWNNNKDWLIGNKEQAGVLPVGLGLFNAFNQYAVGKANINAMKEQNALAREAFQLNKTGALADYEDASAKLARKQYFAQNPNATTSQVYEAAKPLTEERMRKFK